MYDTVAAALGALEDPYLFERVASLVLLDEHPHLQWTGGRRDRGRDAVEVSGLLGDVELVVQYSTADDWKAKLRSELRRYETDTTLPKRYVFVSSQQTYEEDRIPLVKRARSDHDVQLDIRGRGWLELRLESRHRQIAEEHLRVRPRVPARFVTHDRYRQLLRIPGFDAPLVGVNDIVDRVRRLLGDGRTRCVMLTGPGGLGKTRVAFESLPEGMQAHILVRAADLDREAMGELPAGVDAVVVVDNAHRVDDLRGVRHLLDDPRWSGYRVVMTVRPGHEPAVTAAARLDATEVANVHLRHLRRPEIDQIVRNRPHHINRQDLRLAIQHLSGGVPLIAHLAADRVRRGGLDRTGVAELLRGHVKERLASTESLGPQLLSAVAAIGTATREQLDRLAPHLEVPRREVRSAAAALADAGLFEDDGRSYTVTPDSIRPVVIADAFLSSGSEGQADFLDTLDTLLPSDNAEDGAPPEDAQRLRVPVNRTTVLEGLAEAVNLMGGDGGPLLRRLVRHMAPDDDETSARAWDDALREVPAYAAALPDEAADLVRRFVTIWPPNLIEGLLFPVEPAQVLTTAAAAAASVARVDIGLAAALLLDLAELDQGDGRPPEAVSNRLRRLVTEVEPESPDLTTSRSDELVRSVRAVLDDRVSPVRARAMARVLIQVMTPEFEYSRTAVDREAAIAWGRFPAPDTAEHRRVVRDAAELVATLVQHLDDGGLVDLVGAVADLRAAFRRIRDRIVDESRTRRLRGSADEAARIITRCLVDRWDMLPIAVRFRLAATQPQSRLVRERAIDDIDVQRLLALYGDKRGRRDWRREEERARAAGRDLARELGPEPGIAWTVEMLPALDRLPANLSGEFAMLDELGALHGPAAAIQSTHALAASWRTAQGISSFLEGFARTHPADADAVVATLAGDTRTAPYVPRVLDHLTPEAETGILEMLLRDGQRETSVEVAGHLRRCGRMDEGRRAELLLQIAEGFDGDALAQALVDCLGLVDHCDFSRFLQQVRRLLLGGNDGPSEGSAQLVYRTVARRQVDAFMDLLHERVRAVAGGDIRPDGYPRAVPEPARSALAELDEAGRARAIRRMADILEGFERLPKAGYIEEEVWDVFRGVGPGDDAYVGVLTSWADQGGRGVDRAIRGLEGRGTSEGFSDVVRDLAGRGLSLEQQDRLLQAIDPTLHGVDSVAARAMARTLRTWEQDPDPAIRTFARRGARYLEDQANEAEERFESFRRSM